MKKIIFIIFFISGFCGLVYQVIWIRLAYASFGINTQVMSVLLSAFMIGLGGGTWIVGKYVGSWAKRLKFNILWLYAATEFFIGISAFVVPAVFLLGRKWLLFFEGTDSLSYLIFSAVIIFFTILPWCFFMGATIPLIMQFIREKIFNNEKSFSFLYLANTAGAALGTAFSAYALIELLGLQKTLYVAAALNFAIVLICCIVAALKTKIDSEPQDKKNDSMLQNNNIDAAEIRLTPYILFFTGLSSMGLEVVWTRLFTPILKTTVYSFAFILIAYLIGTCAGVIKYRNDAAKKITLYTRTIIAQLVGIAFFQVIINDPRLNLRVLGILTSILLSSYFFGYLTSKLIDQFSSGEPKAAGKAYAINILGCILGPILASYLLLPVFGAKLSIILLGLPFLFFLMISFRLQPIKTAQKFIMLLIIFLLIFSSIFINISYEEGFYLKSKIIERDYSATVIAYGKNLRKGLLVNGIGITELTPITKIMAHLPLALNSENPKKALIICFGMGTTFRSAMSWGLETTAIELTPSVKKLFWYYFDDALALNNDPKGKIIIDDGRRYLQRIKDKYDLITIDPPPPVESAGTSLLYSKEFYEIIKQRLAKNGIMQQWYPGTEEDYYDNGRTLKAVVKSVTDSFPYVKIYRSVGGFGYHLLASMEPIKELSAKEFAGKLPPKAQADLIEWNGGQYKDAVVFAQIILSGEMEIKPFLDDNKNTIITDDRPYNEYYLLRKYFRILSSAI